VFSFTVQVSDSAGGTATAPAKVTVYGRLAITQQPCAAQCVIGAGCVKCGGFGAVGGGAPPYVYRIVGGAVPPGMKYSGLGLSGPFPKGAYSLSVMVKDSLGAAVTVGANWAIYGPATLKAGPDCINLGNPPQCATRWTYSGGHPTVAPKLVILGYSQYCDPNGQCYPVPSSPPMNWKVSVSGGVISISAGGLPCRPNVPYGGVLTIALADATSCPTTSLSNAGKLSVFLENNC
jgi:hypothetical protein